MFWDRTHLYLGITARDRDVRGGFPADAIDPHLWERDTTEIMIDPDGDGDGRDYYEIQIGPQNLVFDSMFDAPNRPRGGPAGPFGHQSWSSGVESAVLVQGTLDDPSDVDAGYVVEARIPFESLARARERPPACGATWRVNLYVMEDNAGVSFSPLRGEGNFHHAPRFGRFVFRCDP